MIEVYDFLAGPALWAAFLISIGGLALRLAYLFGLSRERDREFYNHAEFSSAFRSIMHWMLPLGSVSLRAQPLFAVAFFLFHILLLGIPSFLLAHNTLLQEYFGLSLPALSDFVSDRLTLVFLLSALFLLLRRILRPEVRILTRARDYVLLIMTALPFATGFLAYHQVGPYQSMLTCHVLSAEVLLIAIPFSKLGHCILFLFTRAFIGFEFGHRRGARSW